MVWLRCSLFGATFLTSRLAAPNESLGRFRFQSKQVIEDEAPIRMIRKRQPGTAGRRSANHVTVNSSRGSFAERVRLAIDLLLRDETNQRAFDDCFEMYDGTAVVLAISREAQHNPLLASRIERFRSSEPDLPWLPILSTSAIWNSLPLTVARAEGGFRRIN